MKLVSRSAWGARAYRTPAGATPYSGSKRRGVKFHYLGTPYSDRAHSGCDDYVRSLQKSHMDGNGWSDIGYSFVVCTHGYVYEGRGLRRRNSANGNTTLNNQDYAVCFLVGSSGLTKPTGEQLHGARDALEYVREEGPAGSWVGGHRDGYATACPGAAVYAWVKQGCPRPDDGKSTDPPKQENPPKKEHDMQAKDHLNVPDWLLKQFPDEAGLKDKRVSVETTLISGYGHSKVAVKMLDEQAREIAELKKTVADLTAAVKQLTEKKG